ncbi:unnamed protein product [Owenia fusiformis]|uniref:Uncharacterized protein n=1 Tax=Owenia fusiformis TaxID=6347 RepID=A0A8J1TM52_OWEFU|nr:unnamed protein product [Owenia fusiformis]
MEIKVKAYQPNGTEFEAYNTVRQVSNLDDADTGKQFINTHDACGTTSVGIGVTPQTMVLNIGGSLHEVTRSTLLRFPKTKLARLDESSPHFRAHKGDYYFDRSPEMFSSILNYYRTGALHLPNRLCGLAFQEELDFWGIEEQDIASCCWGSFKESHCVKSALEGFEKCFNNALESEEGTADKGVERRQKCASGMRQKVWLVMNDPTSSTAAKVGMIFITSNVRTLV